MPSHDDPKKPLSGEQLPHNHTHEDLSTSATVKGDATNIKTGLTSEQESIMSRYLKKIITHYQTQINACYRAGHLPGDKMSECIESAKMSLDMIQKTFMDEHSTDGVNEPILNDMFCRTREEITPTRVWNHQSDSGSHSVDMVAVQSFCRKITKRVFVSYFLYQNQHPNKAGQASDNTQSLSLEEANAATEAVKTDS